MKWLIKILFYISFIALMAFVGQQMASVDTHVQILYGEYLIELSFWLLAGGLFICALSFYLLVKTLSLFRPIDSYQRWKEKRDIRKSYRFLKEGVFLWFDGKDKQAQGQFKPSNETAANISKIVAG